MKAVLVAVVNGEKVLDSGTGFVVSKDDANSKTYVLTCAHNLRAAGRSITGPSGDPTRVVVNGILAKNIEDASLSRLDLAVLSVEGLIGEPAKLGVLRQDTKTVNSHGFVDFFHRVYEALTVQGEITETIQTVMADGLSSDYLKIKPKDGKSFKKGLSGGPVCDERGHVIGVSRILEEPRSGETLGYAIRFSHDVLSLVQEKVPISLAGIDSSPDRPPAPPQPVDASLREDDIQKNRWGGKSEGYGCRLEIRILREYKKYFIFDAVLRKTQYWLEQAPLKGPFVFHLHNTYPKPVIWIRATDGKVAVLSEVAAFGTYTLGVQFRDFDGVWRSLEYDLTAYDGGSLKRYD